MGRVLIIKDANFEPVSLGKSSIIEWTDLSSSIIYGKDRTQFLHFPIEWINAIQFNSSLNVKVAVVDISAYAGGRVKFRHAAAPKSNEFLPLAYWTAFASDISIPPDLAEKNVNNWATVVEYIDGSEPKDGPFPAWVTDNLKIPQQAKYLVFNDYIGTPVAKVQCYKD